MKTTDHGAGTATGTGALLTAPQVAEKIGMSVDYVWAMCRRGEIPYVPFGRTRRFREAKLERWLEARERGSTRR